MRLRTIYNIFSGSEDDWVRGTARIALQTAWLAAWPALLVSIVIATS